ncbi:MAG: Smr/MutS family protein [Bacteroidia bacterium]
MHKIQVGSTVKLLDQVGEGTVIGYTRDNRIIVMMTDGFEIPYFEKELVVIKQGNDTVGNYQQETKNVVKPFSRGEILYLGFVLAGISKDSPLIEVQLINWRKEPLIYVLYSETQKKLHLESKGELGSGTSGSVSKSALPELLLKDRFFIQIQPYSNKTDSAPHAWSGYIKYQTPQITEPLNWPFDSELQARALLVQVYPEKIIKHQPAEKSGAEKTGHNITSSGGYLLTEGREGRFEVDLHIEELLENTAGMENSEIIKYQLRHFLKCLDEARQRKIRKFVAIHGVGKGRLRDEIRKLLKEEGITFYDAALSSYGWGATEILVK